MELSGIDFVAIGAFYFNVLIAYALKEHWPSVLESQGKGKHTKYQLVVTGALLAFYLICSANACYWAYKADWWMIFVFLMLAAHPTMGLMFLNEITPEDHPWRKYVNKLGGIGIGFMLLPILFVLGCIWYVCGGFLCFEDQSFGSIVMDFIMSVIALLYVLATLVLIFKR